MCDSKGSCERSDVILVSRALARALVIGPSGVVGDVDVSMGMIVGCSASLFSQCRAGPLSFRGSYLMACRSSPWAMWIWRRKSSIHTTGYVVPLYDSMFTGLNPSGNWCSITSSMKHIGCAAPLYRATSRCNSNGVHMRFSACVRLCLSRQT